MPQNEDDNKSSNNQGISAPTISLPKGGGAIRGIGEKFAANPATGTSSLAVPIFASPGRAGFGPQLSLSYDSGNGNGPFGFGWKLELPSITRKTDKGLPRYCDEEESDVFILSGAEDLVPELSETNGQWQKRHDVRTVAGIRYNVQRYRPRTEGLFARIERWTNPANPAETFWRSISKENLTSWHGRTPESRISDPADPRRIFSWLLCETHDDKGNVVIYQYKSETSDGVVLSEAHERNRNDLTRSANQYPKRITYGNRQPYFPVLAQDRPWPTSPAEWLFELVFDYGEHDADRPAPDETSTWPSRQDPFSTYRPGFELRTYRLCRRALMFHRFAELGETPCLVRSTDFNYVSESDSTQYSFVDSVTQSGYKRRSDGSYLKKSLPPIEFEYSKPVIGDVIREVDPESLENLPEGLDGKYSQWVDLDGEGRSGILTEQGEGWYYKPNLSDSYSARFGPAQLVQFKPSLATISNDRSQLMDLAGDGQLDVVQFVGTTPGFFERTQDEEWNSFVPFESLPLVDWNDPNLKFVDLTGDGHADILISEDDVFCWHPSLAEMGFGPAEKVAKALDEEQGPSLVFADQTQSIYLADMSGGGLSDIVRIRNGEICYWPNLGYGRFGARVTMDGAPWFDHPDSFDQQRIRLNDIDGSGTNDIVYLSDDGVRIYFNQSGNRWSEPKILTATPGLSDLSSVQILDLLGNGTACLVWSSSLPADARQPVHYLELMVGQKPHLLVKTANNLGAETAVQYAPSTRFYLADKLAGRPWVTKLPFPVHVVERVETIDRISGNRFVTSYSYHHGYFDGVEREFRGFGMVEQWDTEHFPALAGGTNIEESSHVPPVLTRTWFHTGVYLGRQSVSDLFSGLLDAKDTGEYYREPGLTDDQSKQLLLDDTVIPSGLSVDEEREACRALRGSMLRQEIYALDGTSKQDHAYTVTEQNFTLRLVQPRSDQRHAVFFTHAREAINYYYDREPQDPRVSHALTLEVDSFGHVLKSAAIGYGRRQPDPVLAPEDQAKQSQLLITCNDNAYTNSIELSDVYRAPVSSETRTYEVTGLTLSNASTRFTLLEVSSATGIAAPIPFEQKATTTLLQKRLIEQVRTYYRPNDLGSAGANALALLPLGLVESRALPGETFKLALTPGLVSAVFGDKVTDTLLQSDARYIHVEGDTNWWVPSGRTFYSPNTNDSPTSELAYARDHFFLAHRFRDPFHTQQFQTESFVMYDRYCLLIQETRDASGNRMTVGERDAVGNLTSSGHDYRVLQPFLISDANRNRSMVATDALWMVTGTAVAGKPEEPLGDSLEGFPADLSDRVIHAHLAQPSAESQTLLQSATTREIYDLFAYYNSKDQPQPQPPVVCTMARETHAADLATGETTKIQQRFSYSDGFGREIQKRIQAEPGPLVDGGPEAITRWVCTGWSVFNNKGNPVRKFEPFFTDTHRYEFDMRRGVSPILCYDPIERVVATINPDHTWQKVVVSPWTTETWDVNDTVSITDPTTDTDVGDFFKKLDDSEYLPTWYEQRRNGRTDEQSAANKATVHASTPTIVLADSLGRSFLTVSKNRFERNGSTVEESYETRTELDIEGNQRVVFDALGRIAMRYDYDMLGTVIHSESMEAGKRWMLNDAAGSLIYSWNSREDRIRKNYDELHRPSQVFLRQTNQSEIMVGKAVYGERRPNAEILNLRGKPYQTCDGGGILTTDGYDFKGNLLSSSRQLALDYKHTPNWQTDVTLEPEVFSTLTRFDALNRPIEMTTPDASTIRPTYNEANLLERVEANLRGSTTVTTFVDDIDYNPKGQRERIEYGNGVITTYRYDPLTFRLIELLTIRGGERLQALSYTYDPVGNITHIRDDAQQTIYFRNKQVDPSNDYTYDAVYQLIAATGREHLGQIGNQPGPPIAPDAFNQFHAGFDQPGDGNAMGTYQENYVYDAVGNILTMQHRGSDPSHPGWTRSYSYNEASLIQPNTINNRLTSTKVGNGPAERYTYDVHGSITTMPHLALMKWDYLDRLESTVKQVLNNGVPETTYYVYDASGQRIRKVTEKQSDTNEAATKSEERIYIGTYEVYREYKTGNVDLERESLNISDDKRRIAIVETLTQGDGSPSQLVRYQLSNHLLSSSIELDETATTISYEEYYPFGSTSYQAMNASIRAAAKRYRFTGMECDEESGLSYHGARYYATWLGRWISCDPNGLRDGANLYWYARNNPIKFSDPTGYQSVDEMEIPPLDDEIDIELPARPAPVNPQQPEPESPENAPPKSLQEAFSDLKPGAVNYDVAVHFEEHEFDSVTSDDFVNAVMESAKKAILKKNPWWRVLMTGEKYQNYAEFKEFKGEFDFNQFRMWSEFKYSMDRIDKFNRENFGSDLYGHRYDWIPGIWVQVAPDETGWGTETVITGDVVEPLPQGEPPKLKRRDSNLPTPPENPAGTPPVEPDIDVRRGSGFELEYRLDENGQRTGGVILTPKDPTQNQASKAMQEANPNPAQLPPPPDRRRQRSRF